MKKTFKKYVWLFEWIAAAFIIAIGIVGVFVDEIILAFTGVALVMIAVLRLFPLLKTTRDKLVKWILAAELLINTALGVYMVYLVFSESSVDLNEWYGYLLGGILYIRGLIFFFETSLRKTSTDVPKFFAHIIFITVGTYIIAVKGFSTEVLAWIILAIALLAAAYITFDGVKNYRNYRREFAAEEATKNIKTEVEDEDKIELPSATDEVKVPTTIDEIEVPKVIEEEKKDEAVVQ